MLHQVSQWLSSLLNSPDFSVANGVAVLGIILTSLGLITGILPLIVQRRRERLLERSFGADFYDSATIQRSTRYYVRPNCSSVDPANESEIRQVLSAEEDLFSVVQKYLSQDTSHRHLLLLADSGMGKSSFVINYYAHNLSLRKRKRQRIAVVPLGIPNALEAIGQISDKKSTVIFLDAFDEDTDAISDHRKRLTQLMQACLQFKRVLITCRTQFFPKDEEIPQQTGVARVAPRLPGEKAVYEFWKLYLAPLNEEQIGQFVRKRYPLWQWRKRNQAYALINRIPFLSARPMLLAYTPDLLASKDVRFDHTFQVYEEMINKWLERESGWIDPKVLLPFSEDLAINLYLERERRGSERISRRELQAFVSKKGVKIEEWKITGRSLLNRDAMGSLKFAHRSIMEYLFVKRFALGDKATKGAPLTDNMKRFLLEMIYDGWKTQNRAVPQYDPTELVNAPLLRLDPLYTLRSTPKQLRNLKSEARDVGFLTSGLSFLYQHIYIPEVRNKTQIITDYASGLQWQHSFSEVPLVYHSANRHIGTMNSFRYAGYARWRLPTLAELLSLLGGSNSHNWSKMFAAGVNSFWTCDSFKTDEARIAVFIGGSASFVGKGEAGTLLSISGETAQVNINVVNSSSTVTASVRAVRTLDYVALAESD